MIPKVKIFILLVSFALFAFIMWYVFFRGTVFSTPSPEQGGNIDTSIAFLSPFAAMIQKMSDIARMNPITGDVPKIHDIPTYTTPPLTGDVRIEGRWDHIQNNQVRSIAQSYPISPHTEAVRFNVSTSGIRHSDPQREFVVIEAGDVVEPVEITDWKIIVGTEKRGYKLPEGVLYFTPGEKNYKSPVRLKNGWHAIVGTGTSPRGRSFHINVCSGYAEQFKDFSPSIKLKCPEPSQEVAVYGTDIPFNDVACYSFINGLQRCSAVIDVPVNVYSKQCRRFVEEVLNEEGCVERHRNDPDFLIGEWRLFLNLEREIYPDSSDALFLLDKENRLVDVLHY